MEWCQWLMTIISHGHQGSPTPVLIRVLVFNMIQTLFLTEFFLEGTPGTNFKTEIPVSSLLGDDLSCFKQAGSLARYTGHPTSPTKNGAIALHPRCLNMIQPQMIASSLGPRPKRRFQGSSWGPRSADTCVSTKDDKKQQWCTSRFWKPCLLLATWQGRKHFDFSTLFFQQSSALKHESLPHLESNLFLGRLRLSAHNSLAEIGTSKVTK